MTNTVTKRKGVGVWITDLAMGFRFAVAGGRSGWIRAGLTALGVGLGVAMLLAAASIPTVVASQDDRSASLQIRQTNGKPDDETLLISGFGTKFHGLDVDGNQVQAYGDNPPIPPGIDKLPRPGEMYVSPALAELLSSEDGKLLRPRLDYEIAGIIADDGLMGPAHLLYYAGSDELTPDSAVHIDKFGVTLPSGPVPAVLVLLIIVAITLMLLPVVMFVAVAVRFGGERRDRRLAALRLVGADSAMVRRVAAGESLFGALAGLALGAIIFEFGVRLLIEARFLATLTSGTLTLYVHDVDPHPAFVAIVVVAVPLVAIFATQLAMRRLVVEPLGVVRQAKPKRRKLWWRLSLVIAGLAAMVPQIVGDAYTRDTFNSVLIVFGVLTLLLGMAALLPWLVETLVARMRGGALSWQLATRRLQLGGGSVTRAIIGIAVAVAGAVALQMLFTSIEADEVTTVGVDPNSAQLTGNGSQADMTRVADAAQNVTGVTVTQSFTSLHVNDENMSFAVLVADCDRLRKLADVGGCTEGDVFGVDGEAGTPEPGAALDLMNVSGNGTATTHEWTVPELRDQVTMLESARDQRWTGLLATPGAIDEKVLASASNTVLVEMDPSRPDTIEHLRNFAAQQSPQWSASDFSSQLMSHTFAKLRQALFVGVVATMLLIGLSLLVNTVEHLQERRRLMSVLVAFGTRRRSLVLSVLWQTAIPVVCGLLIATATGVGLGAMLVNMTSGAMSVDWWSVASINAAGAGMVLLVTLLSFPPLWRMMRPDGIRTE